MHISEGILSAPVLATGVLLATVGVAAGLKKMTYENIPRVAVLSSAFFVASLIQIPLGPASVHLVMNGLLGVLMGWMAFPAILVALALQALLFQFGGLTTLGVNLVVMAGPALLAYLLCRPLLKMKGRQYIALAGFGAGMIGSMGAVALLVLALTRSSDSFTSFAWAISAANAPVIIMEGVITMFCLVFLQRVKPELLET
ncbi:MAG: cobalt transporter CbiM [Smithellaceae bacterium]|nr:cobalt transporter CbiM [Smithellaceae bacterium]